MSKSSKKNQKRANKKHETKGFQVEETIVGAEVTRPRPVKTRDPVEELREQLSKAKAEKNHDLTNKLRQQLWITQDLAAGYVPKISSEDKDSQETLAQAIQTITPSTPSTAEASARLSEASTSSSSFSIEERKLTMLRKKLDQIQNLKKKQEEGVHLEANQLTKMKTEESVLEEIEHLETLLSIPIRR